MRVLSTVRVVLAIALLSGCGPAGPVLVPVTGTVSYQGKPVAKASVSIMSDKGAASLSTTDEMGKFTAQTNGQPGMVAGTAKVMVALTKMVGGPDKIEETPEGAAKFSELVNSGKIRYVSAVPAKYGNIATTPLEITISDDPTRNDFPLELTD